MADGENAELEQFQEAILEFRRSQANADLILVAARKCVDSGKTGFVADILLDQEYKDVLEFVGWELIGIVSHSITETTEEMESESSHSKRILDAVAESCSPKEVCLGVLEQLDSSLPPNQCLKLFQPLQRALERMDQKKSKFLKMVCPQVSSLLRNIPLTEENEHSQDRKESLEMSTALSEVLQFLNPFVEEIYNLKLPIFSKSSPIMFVAYYVPLFIKDRSLVYTNISSLQGGYADQQESLINCLIGLLHYPLVFTSVSQDCELDVEEEQSSEGDRTVPRTQLSCYRSFAEQILQYLHHCSCSFVYLVEYSWRNAKLYTNMQDAVTTETEEEDEVEKEEKEQECKPFHILGLGCFAYLVLVEDIQNDHFPAVFSHKYLLTINMKHISSLLERKESQVVHKGMELLNTLCDCLKERSVEHFHLDTSEFLDTAKALVNIMVMSPSRRLRQEAVRTLPKLISKMDSRGRYKLLHFLLQDVSHPGVAGLLIHALKENVNEGLVAQEKDRWFTGSQLMSLLQLQLKLPSGVGTGQDIVRETDRIMATLNCIRFILLRDQVDQTSLWANIAHVQKSYLEPLRNALRVTRIQYHAELRSKEEEIKGTAPRKKEDSDIEFSVRTLDGNPLRAMPLEEQCEALLSGLCSLDMIESVLARISEIIDSRRHLGT